jgi:hypothetical protein
MQQLKNNIKKLPVIRQWFQRRHLKQELELTQQQLMLAVQSIESISLYNLASCSLAPSSALITSLTSYGTRVQTVHHTILSLLCQSVRPQKIILWLAEDEFTLAVLPKTLLNLQQYGLKIAFCKDIRSYKKLIPTLKVYPNENIVTVDDDVIYPFDHLKKLLTAHKKFPKAVICHRAHRMVKGKHDNIVDYLKWQFDVAERLPAKDIFPVGIGGVLYPAGCFDEEVLNDDAFMRLAPAADDLWFKMMAIKKGTLAKVVDEPILYADYLQIPLTQVQSLWQNNQMANNTQLMAILSAYPEVEL